MSTSTLIHLSPDHGYAALVACGFVVSSIAESVMAASARAAFKNVLSSDNPAVKKLKEEHAVAFDAPISPEGYPDGGSGRYSELLSYKDWMRVNCAQRVHMNYVENIANYFALMGVCSLKFPRVAAISGAVVIAGRIIYGIGYRGKDGAKGRLAGGIIFHIGELGLLIGSVRSALSLLL